MSAVEFVGKKEDLDIKTDAEALPQAAVGAEMVSFEGCVSVCVVWS
jgi:hypothetical protein